MYVICVARHSYLSEHLCSLFTSADIQATPVVGFAEGTKRARERMPDVVICDYDLLASAPLHTWERDAVLSEVPVLAVSMTRRPEEAQLHQDGGVAGFLYLPTLGPTDAQAMVRAAVRPGVRPPGGAFHWETRDRARRAEPR